MTARASLSSDRSRAAPVGSAVDTALAAFSQLVMFCSKDLICVVQVAEAFVFSGWLGSRVDGWVRGVQGRR